MYPSPEDIAAGNYNGSTDKAILRGINSIYDTYSTLNRLAESEMLKGGQATPTATKEVGAYSTLPSRPNKTAIDLANELGVATGRGTPEVHNMGDTVGSENTATAGAYDYRDGKGEPLFSRAMEQRYLAGDKVNENAIRQDAKMLPEKIDRDTFFKQFKIDKNGNTTVLSKNNIEVTFNVRGAWEHFEAKNNTHYDDRHKFSGAFLDVLTDPLAIVKQPHKDRELVFYKPFKDEKGLYNLASIKFKDGGFSYFDLQPMSKVKEIIKSTEGNELYFKYGSRNVGSEEHTTPASSRVNTSTNKNIHQTDIKSQAPSTNDHIINGMFKKFGKESVITLFKTADPVTIFHEYGHFLRATLSKNELAHAIKVFGDFNSKDKNIRVKAEEDFAHAFVKYLHTQDAPTERLKGIFEKIKALLQDFIKKTLPEIKHDLTPEQIEFFKAILGDKEAVGKAKSLEVRDVFDTIYWLMNDFSGGYKKNIVGTRRDVIARLDAKIQKGEKLTDKDKSVFADIQKIAAENYEGYKNAKEAAGKAKFPEMVYDEGLGEYVTREEYDATQKEASAVFQRSDHPKPTVVQAAKDKLEVVKANRVVSGIIDSFTAVDDAAYLKARDARAQGLQKAFTGIEQLHKALATLTPYTRGEIHNYISGDKKWVEVNDGFLSKFMSLLEMIPKDQVKIKTDRYSEEITKRLKSIDNGDDKLVSHADFWGKFDDRVASFKNAN